MTENPTVELPVARHSGVASAEPGVAFPPLNTFRPRKEPAGDHARRFAFGRRLRGLAGVTEEILCWVPEERPRYTRLGAIIFNTGLLAGLSLATALTTFLQAPLWVVIPVALVWAYVIVCFDGWLIASTHGLLSRSRWHVFLPRLILSLLIGAIIAEPLVLWVFGPAIHKNVLETRQVELRTYATDLGDCNPPSGEPVFDPKCAELELPDVPGKPGPLRDELQRVTDDRTRQAGEVQTINGNIAEVQAKADAECNGTPGPGLSGRYGEGVNCRALRTRAEQERQESNIEEREAALDALDSQINDLNGRISVGEAAYETDLTIAIAEKVEERRTTHGAIGILEQGAALERLTATSWFVFAAQWLLRFLLIALDCLPVLTKALGGTTAYDELVTRQLTTSKRLHERDLNLHERRDTAASDVYLRHTELNREMRLKRIAEAGREASANLEADLEAEIDQLAARLRERG